MNETPDPETHDETGPHGPEVAKYCGYGSCDAEPGHTGDHRCRCGSLVDAPANGCAWHTRPEGTTKAANRFADADTVDELVHQAIGAGSSCWENTRGAGEFLSDEALRIGADVMERLDQLNAPSMTSPRHLRFAADVVERLAFSAWEPLPPMRLRALADALEGGQLEPEALTTAPLPAHHTPEALEYAAAMCRHWGPAEYGVDVADTLTGRAAQWLTNQAEVVRMIDGTV